MTSRRTNPRVSIGLPVYNGSRYLRAAIDSILGQSLSEFELVISDNASTDDTEHICRDYARKDSRVHYHRCAENVGAAKNFRRVFDLSTAPYFKWAAHDDLCAPTFLERCVAVLDSYPTVILCYTKSAFIDYLGQVIAEHDDGCYLTDPLASERVRKYFLDADPRCLPQFGVARRSVLEKTSLMAPYISADKILLLQLALQGAFFEVPDCLFFCRDHDEKGSRQFHDFSGVAGWYDPARGGRVQFPRWRLAYEFIKSIANARLNTSESMRCYIAVLKWCKWNHIQFVRDIVLAAQQISLLTVGWPRPTSHNGPGNPWAAWRI